MRGSIDHLQITKYWNRISLLNFFHETYSKSQNCPERPGELSKQLLFILLQVLE